MPVLTPGTEIAGFEVGGLLGRGGMGEVYEAEQRSLGRTVALKVVRLSEGEGDDFRERFRREGRMQAGLHHANIVSVYEAGEFDDGLYLAMQLVRGPTLKQLIRVGALTPARAVTLLAPVAAALDAAHAVGLVHRDVKPQNILVAAGDHPYLADFGLTRGGDDTSLTRTGQFAGTLDYVAPESIRGEAVGPPADIYSYACVIYEALAGQPPFARANQAAMINAHLHDAPASLGSAGLPPAVDIALAAGMAKDPARRPASATDLIRTVERALGDDGSAAEAAADDITADDLDQWQIAGASAAGVAGSEAATVGGAATPAKTPSATTPRPVRGDERAARPRGGLRWLAVVAAVAVLGLAAVIAGRLLAGSEADPSLPTSAASSAVSLHAPAQWSSVSSDDVPAIPGLDLQDAIAVVPAGGGSGVQAGMTDATGATLLPKTFRDELTAPLPAPEHVQLGEAAALRYDDLRVRRFDRELTIFAVPATTGVATVACYAPPAAHADFEPECDRVAATLQLLDGEVLPLGPDPATAERVATIVAGFASGRGAAMKELREQKTRARQASAARAVAEVYGTAAEKLEAADGLSPFAAGRVAAVAASLSAGEAAYARLAAAAAAGDAAAYNAARRAVAAAESGRSQALETLTAIGYRVR